MNKRHYRFFLFLLPVLLDRVVLLFFFGFRYVDGDALILWNGARDYSLGIFREPFFYGQNYNLMLEALLAAPFIATGLPYRYVLPLITSFLSLFPFVYIGWQFWKREREMPALIFLLMPLLLPPEYGMITSVSRGFVTGIFFCSFMASAVLDPASKRSAPIFGISAALAILFNLNSVVFIVPVGLFVLFHQQKKSFFLLHAILWPLAAIALIYAGKYFYILNPEYLVHGEWPFEYRLSRLIQAFSELDTLFAWLNPLWWEAGWFSVCLLLIGGLMLLFLHRKKESVAILGGLFFTLLTLGLWKVHDHNPETILLSSTRMFLALPLCLALAWAWLLPGVRPPYLLLFLFVPLVFAYKALSAQKTISEHTGDGNYGSLYIIPVKDAEDKCALLENVTKAHEVDLVVLIQDEKYPKLSFNAYLCPLIKEELPTVLLNISERRSWIYLEEKDSIRHTVLLYGAVQVQDSLPSNAALLSKEPGMLLLRDNGLTTAQLMQKLGYPLKRHYYQ